ncbi:MAG: PAS/PAC sensor signal transduction histidine [Planctomycetota bacterium]|nr:MAG: PAS/PAC sensor signal transduction histidine [Planctomycetota bacterium]
MPPKPVPLPPMPDFVRQCAWEIDEALILVDLVGTMAWANRRAQALFGYAETEMLGRPVMMLYSASNSPALSKEIVEATLSGGWRGDIMNVSKDGTEFPCQMTTTLIKDAEGRPLGIAGVLVDLRRLWGRTPEEDGEAASGRMLSRLIMGAEGDNAALAIAGGLGMDTVALFDPNGQMAGYAGDPFLKDEMAKRPFPQMEDVLLKELGAKSSLQGVGETGSVVAVSFEKKEVDEAVKAVFRAMLKILRVDGST